MSPKSFWIDGIAAPYSTRGERVWKQTMMQVIPFCDIRFKKQIRIDNKGSRGIGIETYNCRWR